MFATPHTAVGFTIVTVFKENLLIGIPLAIFSHFILDFVNESGLSQKERIYFDMVPSLLCYLLAIITGNFWLFILGSVCGNLFDLIDKKLYLAIFFPSKFKFTYYFHLRKKPLINPTPIVTKAIGIISLITINLIFIYGL